MEHTCSDMKPVNLRAKKYSHWNDWTETGKPYVFGSLDVTYKILSQIRKRWRFVIQNIKNEVLRNADEYERNLALETDELLRALEGR